MYLRLGILLTVRGWENDDERPADTALVALATFKHSPYLLSLLNLDAGDTRT